uniref:Serine palmitoyltransferase small subunit B n=1 Tax=Apteryx owenii TaxID=8824 RepID=A0A8B9QAZ9_APTOW
MKVDIKSMKNYLYWLYCQYELITCSYLMEPWEKLLFYSFNIAVLVMIMYTAYLFIPAQIRLRTHTLKYLSALRNLTSD